MDFFETVKKRQSIRKFKNQEIPEEQLQKILGACNAAPSAGNQQSYEVFVVKKEEDKKALALACDEQEFVEEASVSLVFCTNPSRSKYGKRGKELYALQDATISAAYSQLAAASLGLASCWIGDFFDDQVLKVIGNPKGMVPIAVIPIGFPAETPSLRGRRKLKDLVHELL